jgi:hypothetical protein
MAICLDPKCIWLHCPACHGHWPCPPGDCPRTPLGEQKRPNWDLIKSLTEMGVSTPIQGMITGSWADQVPDLRYSIEDQWGAICGRYQTYGEAMREYIRMGRSEFHFIVDVSVNRRIVGRQGWIKHA